MWKLKARNRSCMRQFSSREQQKLLNYESVPSDGCIKLLIWPCGRVQSSWLLFLWVYLLKFILKSPSCSVFCSVSKFLRAGTPFWEFSIIRFVCQNCCLLSREASKKETNINTDVVWRIKSGNVEGMFIQNIFLKKNCFSTWRSANPFHYVDHYVLFSSDLGINAQNMSHIVFIYNLV